MSQGDLVAVTRASGFIGGHLVGELQQRGHSRIRPRDLSEAVGESILKLIGGMSKLLNARRLPVYDRCSAIPIQFGAKKIKWNPT
jgi:nucleoside-diphosphate-sugar epimerase